MVNGIKGGLVLGRSHSEGGIHLYLENGIPHYTPGYITPSVMQGGEYFVNHLATQKYMKRLQEINDSVKDTIETEKNILTKARFIIDARNINKIIITDFGHYIINRQATIDNIEELDNINSYGQKELITNNNMSKIEEKSEPKCPECHIEGVKYISSKESTQSNNVGNAWFEVVYCNQCGHIYGAIAKHVLSHNIQLPPYIPNI